MYKIYCIYYKMIMGIEYIINKPIEWIEIGLERMYGKLTNNI